MEYSLWQGKRDFKPLRVSKLGFGTTRFNPEDLNNPTGLNRCSALVSAALEEGINYFDVAPTYSFGRAEEILGNAFAERASNDSIFVAGKTGLLIDKSANDAYARIQSSLAKLGQPHFTFYSLWSVMNLEEFEIASRRRGVLEGILRAYEEGLIDHVCVSLHCDPSSAHKIVSSGIFEGVTISVNPINYASWLPFLAYASDNNIWVSTMNTLAGGMVPRYPKLFESIGDNEYSVVQNSLRFVSSLPGVRTVLSGMRTVDELRENCRAFDCEPHNNECCVPVDENSFRINVGRPLCTGCGYCMPCTVGIDIPAMMQAYNHLILLDSIGSDDTETKRANDVFQRARANGAYPLNQKPCLSCGKCEKTCTNKLPISKRMRELSEMAERHCYTRDSVLDRLRSLVEILKGYKTVAVWPSCDYAMRALDLISRHIDQNFETKCEYFNSSSSIVGTQFRGKSVHGIEDMDVLGVDAVLIMHYRYQDELREQLLSVLPESISVFTLHNEGDVDWFNRAAQ